MVALGTAQGQQIVELKIGNEHPVQIGGGYTAIGYIDVPAGRWIVSGLINFWEIGEVGTAFVGANASIGTIELPTDGTSGFTSVSLPRPTNVNLCVTIPPHILRVGNDPRVYLVAWSNMPHQPPPTCYAWGYLCAQKVVGNE